MKLSFDSKIKLHPLNIRKEAKHFVVEDQLTGEFFEMPEVCIIAIQKITEQVPLEIIETELKYSFPNEDVDILEFVNQLIELEMIEEIDGEKVEIEERKQEKLGLTSISPWVGQLFFNKTTKVIYSILFLFCVSLLVWKPSLFPHYKDLFVFDAMYQNIFLWILVGTLLVLIHELGHILAARAYELPTRLDVSHRLFFVVLETDLSLAWKLAPKDRIFIYLAGICFDTVLLFAALIVQAIIPQADNLVSGILAFIVLDVFIRFIYQCGVYMKTDFYYVLENLTGSYNLMENAKRFIFNKKQEVIAFAGEKKIILTYTVFYFVGIFLTLLLFVFFYIPQMIFAVVKVAPGLASPIKSVAFLDAIFVILQITIGIIMLLYSWRKTYRGKAREQAN
ncbi:zinc metalloprotease [Pseudoneobacillus sp. C159]